MGTVRFNEQRRAWTIDYIDATGRRIRQTIGPGKAGWNLARKVLAQREAEAQLRIHRLPAGRTPTFGEFATDWLERQRARGLRPKTLEAYEDALSTHLRPTFAEMRLGQISRRDVEAFVVTKSKATRKRRGPRSQKIQVPYAARTINKMLIILKAILRDAAEHGLTSENPAGRVGALKPPDHEDGLQFLQPDEIMRLLDAPEEPWRTLYLVALHTGMRRGELLGLRWGDVDFRKGVLHVRRSLGRVRDGMRYVVREAPLKTRYSRRTIDLPPTVVESLRAHPAGDDPEQDYVFRSQAGGPIDPDNIDRAWKRHLTTAGLVGRPFHSTRHTHASLLIAAAVHPKAIQARLGHASITTTLNTYGHLMPSAFEGVGERLEALIKATPRQQARRNVERGPQLSAETRVLTES